MRKKILSPGVNTAFGEPRPHRYNALQGKWFTGKSICCPVFLAGRRPRPTAACPPSIQWVKAGGLPGPIPGTCRWDLRAIDEAIDLAGGAERSGCGSPQRHQVAASPKESDSK